MILVVFVAYQGWKRLDNEPEIQASPISSPDRKSARERFREQILSLSPESPTFGDDIAESLRQYLVAAKNLRLSPALTAEQLQKQLPTVLGDIFVRIRNIRYAPKGRHSNACVTVQ